MTKETDYKCRHNYKPIITNNNILMLSAYLAWKETIGYDGNKTKCWDCWCKENRK